MRAIRCQKHHRKHSEPCQVFPFFVKLQSHKCWKRCSYWVLSEVPILQRDPRVPIEIHGAACGKSVGMLVWIRFVLFPVLSPDRELYLNGTCWECRCGTAAPPWALGCCWSAKAPGVIQGTLSGLSKEWASQGITVSSSGLLWGRKGWITCLLLPHVSITLLSLQLLEIFPAQQWICWINGSISICHHAPKPSSVLPRQDKPGLGTVWSSETEGFCQGLRWKSQCSISHIILCTPWHCFQDK